MFRPICQRISTLLHGNRFRLNGMRSFCSEIEPQNDRNIPAKANPTENVRTTICGRLSNVRKHANSEAVSAIIRTNDHDTGLFTVHRLVCPARMATRLNLSSLQDGERVYVDGVVMQDTFTTSDDKERAESSIHPLRIFKSSSLCDGQRDINEVRLFGRIATAPKRGPKNTFLRVATRFNDRKTETMQKKFYTLEVFDEELQNLVNTLNVGALIYVDGRLRSFIKESNNGHRKIVVSIVPNDLFVAKISELGERVEGTS